MLALTCAGCATGNSALAFLPADAENTLGNFDHVEAYRIGSLDDHPGYGGKLDGYAVFQTGTLTPQLSRDLASAVVDTSTYLDSSRTGNFNPAVGYRFCRSVNGHAEVNLDALIDFDESQVLLVQHDGRRSEIFRRLLECDPGRAKLLDLTRQAFPGDMKIQTMP